MWGMEKPSVAFYYGDDPSAPFLESYDRVVVDPDRIDPIWIRRYPDKLFAYVSVGESAAWREGEDAAAAWRLGRNDAWQSDVVDYCNSAYLQHLLANMEALHKKGYNNFFLDTLDSPLGKSTTQQTRQKEQEALAKLLQQIRRRFPNAKLIANRGVEVMDTLCKTVDAFAIESLYKGIDATTKAYVDVSPEDRRWVVTQLEKAKACGLQPIVIDYLPEKARTKRREIARKIAKKGYTPWVADRYLQHYGEGASPRIRREVLLLYDASKLKDGDKVYANAHLMTSMPLEYLGYIPVLKDISKGLPYGGVDRYSGVIVWPDSFAKDQHAFFAWITSLTAEGQKILFLNDFGFEMTPLRAKKLHLSLQSAATPKKLFAKVTAQAPICNAEIPPLVTASEKLIDAPGADPLISAQSDDGTPFTPAAITSWGGYAVYGSAEHDISGEPIWSIDPFALIQKTLRLPAIPVPDPTTENGRRIMFIHIDGDGFIEKVRFAPEKYASQMLLEKILTKYPFPHSVSIIEGEIGPDGLYPQLSPKMERYARKIFRLPHVEIASHSFSHPFKWQKAEHHTKQRGDEGAYHLPIPGYEFNLTREILGSVGYIDSVLAPRNKHCNLFFWTGDCLPRSDALRMCEMHGLGAINGGDTTATDENPWLVRIAPFGLQRGPFWQIYVGEQNENIYTNDWRGPFWGYRKVLETFAITDHPRRLKPIDIYYHFYSASRKASLEALRRAYDYASKRETTPLFTSEYIAIAHDFYTTSLTRDEAGWHIRNSGALRTLRLPESLGYPDILHSRGIAGFRKGKGFSYLHLDGSGDYLLQTSRHPLRYPHIVDSNGRIVTLKKSATHYRIKLHANVVIEARFNLPKGWHITHTSGGVHISRKKGILQMRGSARDMEVTFVHP